MTHIPCFEYLRCASALFGFAALPHAVFANLSDAFVVHMPRVQQTLRSFVYIFG